jgi:hypothetical protein
MAALATLVIVRAPQPEEPELASTAWPNRADLAALRALVAELEHGGARA